MTRSQIFGFAFIAALAVAIAVWLSVSDPPPPAPTSTRVQPTSLAPAPAEQKASTTTTKRATRSAQATQLKQRLELVARALDEAKKKQPAPPGTTTTTTAPATEPETEEPPTKAAASGTLTKDQVQAGVAEVKPQIVGCYEQALAQNPKLAGSIKVLFEIGEDPDDTDKGAVVAGEVDSEMGSPFFEACVLQSIVGARFPRPEGGVVKVTYPFAFESHDDDSADDSADAGP